jgi:hypothetical protein
MALLAQHPGNGVHDIGLAAAIGADDAREPASAERNIRLFAERFESNQLDFAQFKQDLPFVASAAERPDGPSPSKCFHQHYSL